MNKQPRPKKRAPRRINDILVTEVKLPKKASTTLKAAKKALHTSKQPSLKKAQKTTKRSVVKGPRAAPAKKKGNFFTRLLDKELHRHPFATPVITITVLSFLTLAGFVFMGGKNIGAHDSQTVQLSIDGEKIVLPTKAPNVADFLDRAKVDIKEGDVVEPALNTSIDVDDFRINVYRAKKVTIVDEGKRIPALSAATTPRAIAAQVGIRVYSEDRLTLTDPQEVLRNNLLEPEIVIDRATPVSLNVYGEPVTVRTHAETVEQLLEEKGIVLAEKDQIIPKKNTVLSENTQVFVTRVGIKIATETVKIPNEVQTVDDDSLSFGTTAVRQAGSPGSKIVTYEISLENGQEVSRKKIQEVITKKPVERIVARGKAISIPEDKTQWMVAAGIQRSDFPYVQYILDHENRTWCPTRWQGQYHCPPYYEPIHSENSGFGYGLCQSTPAIKMATAGDDWRTNPVTQLKWCHGYALGRYGSWEAAYNFWTANRWW